MVKIIATIFFCYTSLFATDLSIYKKANRIVEKRYGTVLISKKVSVSTQLKHLAKNENIGSDSLTIWKDGVGNSAVLYRVKSKSTNYNILLFINCGVLEEVKLVGVVDQRAALFTNRRWLSQFIGKTYNSPFKIDAISGATISSKDIINAIKKIVKSNFENNTK